MKAVILAGGEGQRLQPVSVGTPKALLPLLGRPVVEHTIALLRSHGFTEICMAVCLHAEQLRACLGDGSRLGVKLTWAEEETGLGTAGAVCNCRAQLGESDVLVVSGDVVSDVDLTELVRFHREHGGAATIAVCSHPRPLEYGLVVTDQTDRVTGFVEKPGWEQTVTDRVNTGIYMLDASVVKGLNGLEQPDFGRDVFPGLLTRGEALYAFPVQGYWRDVGDCGDYLDCCAEVLSGKIKLDMGVGETAPGVWSAAEIPDGVEIIPPCWIGPGVVLEPGSLIGPHAVLERGSRVGRRSLVQRSVLMEGAQVGQRSTLYGAVLCRDARVGDEAVLNEGVVLGQNALVQDRAVLMERVRLWPGRTAAEGCRLSCSVTGTGRAGQLRFGDGGVIRGVLGEDVGPEQMLILGSALADQGKIGLGGWGGPGAQMLLRSAVSGVTAGGGTALVHDMECPAQAAWMAEHCRLPVSLFIQQEGQRIYLHLFDNAGLALTRQRQRKLEQAVLRGPVCQTQPGDVGGCEHMSIGPRDYARDGARRSALGRTSHRTLRVAVEGDGPADRALRAVLEELGCVVVDQWRRGIPAFQASYGGFRLTARDESGAMLSPQQLLTMVALIEMEQGAGRLAVPDDASAAIELVAAGFGKPVWRLGRDGEVARELYRTQPWLRHAAFAAARLCSRMSGASQRLEQLAAKTPRLCAWRREVSLVRDRGEIMRLLSQRTQGADYVGAGMRLRTGGGWVYLVPLARRRALKVVAESADMELAAELCDLYADKVRRLDGEQTK
ncbi:MAG: NTP transferase domain-containing protein [Oscillospiraceae bacterium]|nr:NTP transferase domain-containing protein [Oscillospiraceae bacterium]